MDHLTDAQQEELRAELDAQLERLERSLELSAEAARPVELDQQAVGRLSRMDSLLSQGMAQNLREREASRLAALVGALKRFDTGEYGICGACDEPIPFGRLMVVPETVNCSACAPA